MQEKVNARSNFGLYGWILTIYAFLTYAASGSQNQTFSVLNEYYTDTLGWTNTQQQTIITIAGVVCCIVMVFVGSLVRKISPRKTAFTLLLVSGILFYVCSYVNTYILMAVIFVVTRCVAQTCSMQLNGVFINNWFPKKRGLVIGWATCGQALSTTISTILMGWGLAQFGIQGAYGIISLISIVCAFVILFVLRDYPEELGKYPDNDPNAVRQSVEQIKHTPSVWTWQRVLTTKEFWLISLSIAVLVFGAGFMSQIVPVIMSAGFAPPQIPLIMTLIGVAACFGSYVSGVIDVKLGTKKAIIVVDVALIIMGILANTGNQIAVVVALACLAMMLGGGSNFAVSMCSGCWGRAVFGDVIRFMMPITVFISSLAPVIIAKIAEVFHGYGAAFVFASILGVVSILLILPVGKDFAAKKEAQWTAEAK